MKIGSILLGACAVIWLGGCNVKKVNVGTVFVPKQVEWFNATGGGTISGTAFIRQRGGTVVTCAGGEVTLRPWSSYAAQRFFRSFGSATKAYHPVVAGNIEYTDDSYQYYSAKKSVVCDQKGEFTFSNLPVGVYYLLTTVTWSTGGYYSFPQGGLLIQKVNLLENQDKKVIMTP